MSERKSVPKPEKKAKSTDEAQPTAPSNEEALIDIPAVKKKKERRVKSEAEIAAKAERKRLRKEAEAANLAEKQAKKNKSGAPSAGSSTTTAAAGSTNVAAKASDKVPKWKQFLKNTADADNAEKLKSVEFDVEQDDDEEDTKESENEREKIKADKKRKAEQNNQEESNKKAKAGEVGSSGNAPLDMSTPGLQYLVEWKRFRAVWKFQKMRQVWLLKHMYNDADLPDTHWPIFLEYIKDLKGAARTATIEEAQKIVDAPEQPEDDQQEKEEEDVKMKDEDGESSGDEEEDEAKKEAQEQKRQREVKAARALELLQLLA
ncbi:hypothetical protein DFQ27_007504 [Actinomortierella ambigua]|uniref:WKF domain-containing protein n=1 Tax=Actinomortierella ambigua TaxID=1343610 RepID=A0A9P6PUZ0_9FUNG|nr:hypothetical protein DFQ27_007504 [Actinomortierella ambigua]